MIKKFKFILLLLAIFDYSVILSQEENESLLLGKITKEQWKAHETWDVGDYKPDKDVVAELKKNLKGDIEIYLFAGTWCSDSQKNVPQIYRLFDDLGISDKVQFYGVNREKIDPEGKSMIMSIEKVPTIVVLRKGIEIGRITEYPSASWEKDLLSIVENK